jgi:hypothetical protein
MKKNNFFGLLMIAGTMSLIACGTSPNIANYSNTVSIWQSEVEDYLLSQHDKNNNFIYFFIKNEKQNENSYAFIITDQMNESDRMQCLVNYSTTGDIPGLRTTKASANWYNDYSPVVIQDDHNGISLAAFSLPKDIMRIWILALNVTVKNNQANTHAFPLTEFELTDEPEQYYLINPGADKYEKAVSSMNRAEMEKYFKRTTFYATQVGKKFQFGYIAGKGQELMLME